MLSKTKNGFLSHFADSSKHGRKWSDEQIEDMRSRRLKGETWQSIANDYNCDRSSIHRAVQRHNPIIENTIVPKGYIDMKTFMALSGETYMAIFHRIKRQAVDYIKIKNKLYIKHDELLIQNKHLSVEQIDAIICLHNNHFKIIEIAKALKLTRSTVSKYIKLNKHGDL